MRYDRFVPADAMNLVYCRDEIIQMLDDIVGEHLTEMTIWKRPGQLIEIVNDIWIRIWRQVRLIASCRYPLPHPKIEDSALADILRLSGAS